MCSFGDKANWEQSKSVQSATVHGIGKFSHITLKDNIKTFDFGQVFVGRQVEKKIIVENHSSVAANFKIKKSEKDTDPYFEFSTTQGTIPSGQAMEIGVTYSPASFGLFSNAYFDIATLSGNTIRINCKGSGAVAQIALSSNVINFNDVSAGVAVSRAIYLENRSSVKAFYQVCHKLNIVCLRSAWNFLN